MKTRLSIGLFALCLAALTLTAGVAAKNSRPFKGRGEAVWDNIFKALPPAMGGQPPATFDGTGQATHLGRIAQHGTLFLDAPTNGIFPGRGSVTLTAANGDTVTFDFQGELNANTGEGQGRFTVTGGTGRFANATGAGTFHALINLTRPANQPMAVELNGRITY
jgi:hypothetical protein